MYKVCWASFGCSDMDILAAFEAAIHDGVDVISISIGGGSSDYVTDSIAVGAFHAMKKGIITVASAGNDGPSLGSVANNAPWLVTVAASGIDRSFMSQIQLGNGKNVSVRIIHILHFYYSNIFLFSLKIDLINTRMHRFQIKDLHIYVQFHTIFRTNIKGWESN